IGEGELMAHDVPLGCAPDEYDDLISGTCSHLPLINHHQKLLLICKKLFQNFMLSLDGSFACKGVMSR
ncbi:hypothetical protein, partial [Klebsiella pneumoniae]|uniref:hypothetical protein n=1 Tax=Klebsiella pneumoniae TaxID=573 RepID=UPI001C5DDC12